MHEIALVEEVIWMVTRVARDHHLKRVKVVNVSLGSLLQIQPELFHFAFDAAITGSLLEGAVLRLERVEPLVKCQACGQESTWNKVSFACPHCQSMTLDIIEGREMIIQSIEGE